MKICRENPNLIKIGQISLELYVKFQVSFIFAGTFRRRKSAVFEWHGVRLLG
jgi:hypothetical protein